MRINHILQDVRLVIADLEVPLGDEWRSSPTLCAVVATPEGRAGGAVEHTRRPTHFHENGERHRAARARPD